MEPTDPKPIRGKGMILVRVFARFLFIALASAAGTGAIIACFFFWQDSPFARDPEHESAFDCNVMALDVHGEVDTTSTASDNMGYMTVTSSGALAGYLEQAAKDSSIKAVLLDVDSPGGYPQAAREVTDALRTLGKPSVAWIRGYGDSAAYWIASATNVIVASPESDVGSIGVTASYTDNSKQNADEGITYNSISTGKFKDTGNPDKPLTTDEREYIQKQNQSILEDFIQDVATFRNLSADKVRALADGSSLLGREAKDAGLVDRLGTRAEAMAALKDAIHEDPRLCWPEYQ